MSLQKTSFFILAALLGLLVVAGVYPSPLTIMLVAGVSSALVLLQSYIILRDDSGSTSTGKPYLNQFRRK